MSYLNPLIVEEQISDDELVLSLPSEGSIHALNSSALTIYKIYSNAKADLSDEFVVCNYIEYYKKFNIPENRLLTDAHVIIKTMKEKGLLLEDDEDDIIALQRRNEEESGDIINE